MHDDELHGPVMDQIIEGARRLIERRAFNAALDATPELSQILARCCRGELTKEEAKQLAKPHILRFAERYVENLQGKATGSD